ncbi:hypothetical protein HBI74_077060 [Parastagonospora nodorum]|nr:hypothetical protein HBI74_077060 [Parastagonospora nodorum]
MCAKDDLVGRKGPLSTSTQTWEVLFQTHDGRLAGELATAESVTAKDPNHVDTFGSDFAFSFAAWLQRIKCTLGDVDSLFADAMSAMQSGIQDDIWIQEDIAKTLTPGTLLAGFIPTTKIRDPLLKTLENAAKSGILLACADRRTRQCYLTICAILADYEEQVLLTGVKKNRYCTRCTVAPDDREDLCGSYLWRTEQFTRLQQERCLDKGHDDFVHLVDCFGWKHYNFNIYVSLATDTLHLLLKGLVMKMLDFMQDMLDDIYSGSRKTWDNSTTLVTQESGSTQLNERFQQKAIIQQLVAVVSPLFVSKAPFALHFIRAVCDLVTLAQYKMYRRTLGEEKNFNYPKWHALTHIIQDIRMYGALDGICTGANSEAHYITMVKQFYSMTNKKEYILQICLHNSRRTALLAADHATVVKQNRTYSTRVTRPLPFRRLGWLIPGIQPHSTKLPLSEVAANIAISDFIYAAAVFVGRMSVQIYPSIKCWRSSGKRHNDPEHCDEEVLYLILTIIDYTCYDKDGKHMAYIGAFSKVLLFNNNGQIDNTTGMLSVPFKFYDLSTIIRLVHLVLRDLPDLTTRTTMSYYVNNYIDWDEYNRLYLPIFDIDLLRMLREY